MPRLLHYLRVAVLALAASSAFATESLQRPNFIIILADDLGYGDLGCYGNNRIRTPNLDRMAGEGMRFTDFYVASAICSPSRAALLTGCYPPRVGLGVCSRERDGQVIPWHVLYPNSRQGLNASEVTLAEQLKSQGYETACVGKWHLGEKPEFRPTSHGFDSYFGVPYSNDMKPMVMMRDGEIVEKEAKQEALLEQYTEEAIKVIAAKKDKPFFLYLAHNAPHTPLHVSERFRGKSQGGLYGDVVESLDWSCGEILAALKKQGIDDRTMVVFFSDNGPWLVRGEKGGRATPLRNGKGSTYEGGMRVPCIARWPGRIPAASTCSQIATSMDFYPTFASLSGGKIKTTNRIDGKDISSLLLAKPAATTPHDAFYYYFMDELQAVRSGPWKLKLETTVEHDSHYTHYGDPETTVPEALYNLEDDPGEQKSVLKDHPKVLEKLRGLADEARKDIGDSYTGVPGANRRPAGFISAKE